MRLSKQLKILFSSAYKLYKPYAGHASGVRRGDLYLQVPLVVSLRILIYWSTGCSRKYRRQCHSVNNHESSLSLMSSARNMGACGRNPNVSEWPSSRGDHESQHSSSFPEVRSCILASPVHRTMADDAHEAGQTIFERSHSVLTEW